MAAESGSESDIAPTQTAGPNQPAAEGGSEVQAIIIPGSPKSGPIDQMELAGVARFIVKGGRSGCERTSGNPPFQSG